MATYNPITAGAISIPPGTRSFSNGSTDIVKATAELLIKQGAFTNLLSDLNEYVAVKRLMPKHKKAFSGGLDWTFNVAIGSDNTGNGTAAHVGLFENDDIKRVEALVQGKVSPRFITANYCYDKREPVLNTGTADKSKTLAIVNFVKEQMALMYQSYYNLLEADAWGSPTYADDKKTPHGIKFFLQRQSDADAATHPLGGFDGKDPSLPASSSSSTPTACPRCNIATSTYARWANWAAQYAAISKEDLVKKMRYAARKTNFLSPLTVTGDPTLSSGKGIYCNIDTLAELESILEAQNMNLGNDVASKDGKTLFKGTPVEYVPYLDSDSQDPIYLIDWKTLVFGTLDGWYEKVTAPKEKDGQHNTMIAYLDTAVEMVCTNLRNQAVIAKAAD